MSNPTYERPLYYFRNPLNGKPLDATANYPGILTDEEGEPLYQRPLVDAALRSIGSAATELARKLNPNIRESQYSTPDVLYRRGRFVSALGAVVALTLGGSMFLGGQEKSPARNAEPACNIVFDPQNPISVVLDSRLPEGTLSERIADVPYSDPNNLTENGAYNYCLTPVENAIKTHNPATDMSAWGAKVIVPNKVTVSGPAN